MRGSRESQAHCWYSSAEDANARITRVRLTEESPSHQITQACLKTVRKHGGLGDSDDSFDFWQAGEEEEEEEEGPTEQPGGDRSERDPEEIAKALHAEYLEAMIRYVENASLVSLNLRPSGWRRAWFMKHVRYWG